jgi:hypothetical protein
VRKIVLGDSNSKSCSFLTLTGLKRNDRRNPHFDSNFPEYIKEKVKKQESSPSLLDGVNHLLEGVYQKLLEENDHNVAQFVTDFW